MDMLTPGDRIKSLFNLQSRKIYDRAFKESGSIEL
jgi:hypothetical protein